MATITGITAKRAQEIADASVVSGSVNSMGNLLLATRGGQQIDAGNVKGPQGLQGIPGLSGGPATLRNSTFGVPANATEQVALANKVALWYNTDSKSIEIYLATDGMGGLTVPGTSDVPGWYPLPQIDNLSKGLNGRVYTAAASSGISNTWVMIDYISYYLTKDRWYRVSYKSNSLAASEANMAFALALRSSAVADTTATGTDLTDSHTLYTAPSGGSGKAILDEFVFKATVSGTVNLKLCATRATGSTTFTLSNRELIVFDQGKNL